MGIFLVRSMFLCLLLTLKPNGLAGVTVDPRGSPLRVLVDPRGSPRLGPIDPRGHHSPDNVIEDLVHKDVHCGVPANISHGHYEYLSHHDEDTYLSVIKYVCDGPVYFLEDPEEAVYVCTENNKWKNAKLKYHLPECHKVSCGVPADIEHGHFEYVTTHGVTSYLSAIKYTCDANYHERDFSDEGVYVCTIEGKWRNTDLDYHVPTCEPVECGRPVVHLETHQRVVGGQMVINGASPWSMLLRGTDGEIIDGALIDHQWMLTSAHALQGEGRQEADIKANFHAYVGIEDAREMDSAHEVHIESIFYHLRPKDAVVYRSDLALVKLRENITFSNHIMPICLPTHQLVSPGKVGHLAGWGVGAELVPATHLLYVELGVGNTSECLHQLLAGHPGLFDEGAPDLFCTELTALGENVCRGDRGAPFVLEEAGVEYAAGVLSYDEACRAQTYAVYTNVFDYVEWIKEVIANH